MRDESSTFAMVAVRACRCGNKGNLVGDARGGRAGGWSGEWACSRRGVDRVREARTAPMAIGVWEGSADDHGSGPAPVEGSIA